MRSTNNDLLKPKPLFIATSVHFKHHLNVNADAYIRIRTWKHLHCESLRFYKSLFYYLWHNATSLWRAVLMHPLPRVLLCQTAVNATTAELLRKQEELEKKARELERRERELESHSLGPGACKRGGKRRGRNNVNKEKQKISKCIIDFIPFLCCSLHQLVKITGPHCLPSVLWAPASTRTSMWRSLSASSAPSPSCTTSGCVSSCNS